MNECTRCNNALTEEEIEHPDKEEGTDDVICSSCWSDLYQDECTRCCEYVMKTELNTKPGALIGIWRDAPACGQDPLKAGYYVVRSWPIFADGMIEGYFFGNAVRRVADLDEQGERRAKDQQYMSGPICRECQGRVALAIIAKDGDSSPRPEVGVPEGWKLVPLEITPEMLAAASNAVVPTASFEDIQLARKAAPLVMLESNPDNLNMDMVAAMMATMPPFYRAMLAAAPAFVRSPLAHKEKL